MCLSMLKLYVPISISFKKFNQTQKKMYSFKILTRSGFLQSESESVKKNSEDCQSYLKISHHCNSKDKKTIGRISTRSKNNPTT